MSFSVKNILKLFIVFSLMTISGFIAFVLRIVSFNLLVEFNRKYLIPSSSKLTMAAVGIKLEIPSSKDLPEGKNLITFNHNSYLDIFALTAIGYANTVFLLSEKTLRIIPLTLSAIGIGVMYIPQKKHPERRQEFFDKLEKRIKSQNINIAASSEGVHDHRHGIDVFNTGIYRIAVICKMRIVPLFINVPKESNPLNKYKEFQRGLIKVDNIGNLETDDWEIDRIDEYVDMVRNKFVQKFNEVHEDQTK